MLPSRATTRANSRRFFHRRPRSRGRANKTGCRASPRRGHLIVQSSGGCAACCLVSCLRRRAARCGSLFLSWIWRRFGGFFASAAAPRGCGQYEVLLARGYVQRCAPQVVFCSTAGAGPSVSTHTSAAGNTLPSEENLSERYRRALLPQPSAALCSPLSPSLRNSRGHRCFLATSNA